MVGNSELKDCDRPVVFVGPFEHHSNEVSWRETVATVVCIPEGPRGNVDLDELAGELDKYADRPLKICSFSAASNVTGIKNDMVGIARVAKSKGALCFVDYASAGAYGEGVFYDACLTHARLRQSCMQAACN